VLKKPFSKRKPQVQSFPFKNGPHIEPVSKPAVLKPALLEIPV
jgi:hypothetical protein